jgi:RNA polymerase sigma-70 factor (ECF subfamily)
MIRALPASASPDGELDFQELIDRVARERDRASFESLFLFFGPRVKGLMIRSGAQADLAEDIAQEVFVTVWRKAELYSPEKGNVSTWIFTIARNIRIDRLRRQSSRPYEDVAELEIASPEAGGEQVVSEVQRDRRVADALRELKPDQRKVIELSFVHDMPQAEIAKKLDLPLGTVKSRMRLAYAKLRERLEDLK